MHTVTCIHACMYTCIHACRSYTHWHIQTVHANIHACIHTHMHTCIYRCILAYTCTHANTYRSVMAGIERDLWPFQWHRIDRGCFTRFIRFAAERRLLWPPAKIRQLTIARASMYSLHFRRYGVTITGLLVTVSVSGRSIRHIGRKRDRYIDTCLHQNTFMHACITNILRYIHSPDQSLCS